MPWDRNEVRAGALAASGKCWPWQPPPPHNALRALCPSSPLSFPHLGALPGRRGLGSSSEEKGQKPGFSLEDRVWRDFRERKAPPQTV